MPKQQTQLCISEGRISIQLVRTHTDVSLHGLTREKALLAQLPMVSRRAQANADFENPRGTLMLLGLEGNTMLEGMGLVAQIEALEAELAVDQAECSSRFMWLEQNITLEWHCDQDLQDAAPAFMNPLDMDTETPVTTGRAMRDSLLQYHSCERDCEAWWANRRELYVHLYSLVEEFRQLRRDGSTTGSFITVPAIVTDREQLTGWTSYYSQWPALAAMAESAGLTRQLFQQDLDFDGDTQGLIEHEGRCKYIARMRLTWAKCSKLVIGGRASVADSTLSRIQLVDTYIGSCTSHVLQMICKLAYSQPTK